MDNAPSHKLEEGVVLKCTRVKFLPPNTTTHLQPIGAGIIANFKHHYKKMAIRIQLNMIINNNPVCISPYQALCMCNKAWASVTAQTIENCWMKTDLIPRLGNAATTVVDDNDQVQLEEIQESLDEMQRALPSEHVISAEQCAAADRDLPTEAELSVEEAIQIVLSHDQEEELTDSAPAIHKLFLHQNLLLQ